MDLLYGNSHHQMQGGSQPHFITVCMTTGNHCKSATGKLQQTSSLRLCKSTPMLQPAVWTSTQVSSRPIPLGAEHNSCPVVTIFRPRTSMSTLQHASAIVDHHTTPLHVIPDN
jgi:hypothetical protein